MDLSTNLYIIPSTNNQEEIFEINEIIDDNENEEYYLITGKDIDIDTNIVLINEGWVKMTKVVIV